MKNILNIAQNDSYTTSSNSSQENDYVTVEVDNSTTPATLTVTPKTAGTTTITAKESNGGLTKEIAVTVQSTVTVSVNKNETAWSDSGMNVSLRTTSDATTDAYTYVNATKNGNTVKWSGVENGTYYIFAGTSSLSDTTKSTVAYTGQTITVNNNTPTQTINYYDLTLNKDENTASVTIDETEYSTTPATVSYLSNQTANINATSNENYKFKEWMVATGNTPTSTTTAETTVAMDKATTLTATSEIAATLELSSTILTVFKDDEKTININGENYGELSISYSNETPNATAIIDGTTVTITGVAEGTETITVNSSVGIFASCKVTVIKVDGNFYSDTTNNFYDTLGLAYTATETGGTIILAKSCSDESTVSVGESETKSITIDINNKTLTRTNEITVENDSTLNIIGETGKITSSSQINVIKNSGTLNIDGGTIESTIANISYAPIYNKNTLTINGGTIKGVYRGVITGTSSDNGFDAQVTMNDGNVQTTGSGNDSSAFWSYGGTSRTNTLNINGGTIAGQYFGIYTNGTVKTTIGGNINSDIYIYGEYTSLNNYGRTCKICGSEYYAVEITGGSYGLYGSGFVIGSEDVAYNNKSPLITGGKKGLVWTVSSYYGYEFYNGQLRGRELSTGDADGMNITRKGYSIVTTTVEDNGVTYDTALLARVLTTRVNSSITATLGSYDSIPTLTVLSPEIASVSVINGQLNLTGLSYGSTLVPVTSPGGQEIDMFAGFVSSESNSFILTTKPGKIKGQYSSLSAASAAANNNPTGGIPDCIWLTSDCDDAEVGFTTKKSIIICLQTYTLTRTQGIPVEGYGSSFPNRVSIVGEEGGTFKTTSGPAAIMKPYGALTVHGGTLEGETYGILNDYESNGSSNIVVYGGRVTGRTASGIYVNKKSRIFRNQDVPGRRKYGFGGRAERVRYHIGRPNW